MAGRNVPLFKIGDGQAVCIPPELELPGDHAIMRKQGDRLIIEPVSTKSILTVLAELAPLDEELPAIQDAPPEPIDL